MTRCVVLGANGQDGSYLCETLAAAGAEVWGVARQSVPAYPIAGGHFYYLPADLRDHAALARHLAEIRPDHVYHLAAVHGAAGTIYETVWDAALDVNVRSMHPVLEYLRHHPAARAVYASSAKVLGTPPQGRLSIHSPRRADCLYATTKIAAENLIAYYRRAHKVHCGIALLFNHESPRRAPAFFVPRLVGILRGALNDRHHRDRVATLDFHIDWGCAREYMGLLPRFVAAAGPVDAVLASGRTWHGRQFAQALFARHGLDFRDHVEEGATALPSPEFQVDVEPTRQCLGAVPQRCILDVCADILAAEAVP